MGNHVRGVVSIALFVLLPVATGCVTTTGGNQSCELAADCDDRDDCTDDTCAEGSCVNAPITDDPACALGCKVDADCDDGSNCTTDECGTVEAGVCSNELIPGCGACETDAACDDGIFCTIDTCDGLCGHEADPSPACAACDDDDSCAAGESCFCADCVADERCAIPDGCTEILLTDVNNFGEGDVTGLEGEDLEGAGLDIFQAFDEYPDGITEIAPIADHDDCFADGIGCMQLRINVSSTVIELMSTSGSWLHEAGNTGAVAGVTFGEYTQGVGGVMTYVEGGRCMHLRSATYP